VFVEEVVEMGYGLEEGFVMEEEEEEVVVVAEEDSAREGL